MHGLGNDFVIIDSRNTPFAMSPAKARNIADRRTGIGCDQLIILEPSDKADLRMKIYNNDGGEVESCGNASRCVVSLVGHNCTIETAGGLLDGKLTDQGVTIDMGVPRFGWQDIPLAYAMDSAAMPLAWEELLSPMAVNVGNPHAIFFVKNSDVVDLERLGPLIEQDPVFPERVNVNVASIEGNSIVLHVWERGAGLTRACGTGACATAVAAIKKGLVQSPVEVRLPGGSLTISWEQGANIVMTGDATHVFNGSVDWDSF